MSALLQGCVVETTSLRVMAPCTPGMMSRTRVIVLCAGEMLQCARATGGYARENLLRRLLGDLLAKCNLKPRGPINWSGRLPLHAPVNPAVCTSPLKSTQAR